jgi:hypothetical protein
VTAERCSCLASVCAALAASALAGCAAGPHDLAWTIEFETPALAARATAVHAAILEGGCGGVEAYAVELRPGVTMSPAPPRLAAGHWGFYARASDATCTSFASICEVVTLPTTSGVRLVLAATTERADCPPTECAAGACRGDAGTSDAGTTDAGTSDDAGLEDASLEDAALDDAATEPDACMPTEIACGDALDDDCDGTVDCADADCAATSACDACTGVTCPVCQSCAAGTCGPSVGACPGGRCAPAGSCCTGCVVSETCAVGNTAAACGSGGSACHVCGPCEQCSGGACVPRADGLACTNGSGVAGLCTGGACCVGCVDGTGRCVGGSISATACGAGGHACVACTECHRCSAGACIPTTGSCGTDGRCQGGSCCQGADHCWTGTACVVGTSLATCGGGGNPCDACSVSQGCCQPFAGADWDCRASCL